MGPKRRRAMLFPIRGKPWRKSARSLLPRWPPPIIPTLRRIPGLSVIQPQACKASRCRCRHRKPRGNSPMRFPRLPIACEAGLRDRRGEMNDDRLIRRIGDGASNRAVGSRSADGLIGSLLVSIGWQPSEEGFDQSMPIVAETVQIPSRRNSSLNSRAQFSDGPGRRFFVVRGKNLLC